MTDAPLILTLFPHLPAEDNGRAALVGLARRAGSASTTDRARPATIQALSGRRWPGTTKNSSVLITL